ncbi:NAD(P)-dependent oxidoreductase [Flavobacterium cerinum]|uniref:NAD-dependent epimerase/dehydratase family protein n=1 Tax=Flavobacterium cerinum TaxID=2502784 RepID=A0A3S3QTF2_9FLAO|nr:NAD(P)H-binding protein [Flavobacterium cerinum]RWX02297.1 NAD-dependent epimerase/dehydratase family protein [Flavobacterium cerinum]
MKSNIKIAVIGGTGKSGKYLIKQLISQGFQLKALVRNPENFTIDNPLVEIVQGNAADYTTILDLIEGCDALISTLGLGIPASEKNIFSTATTNILRAMEQRNIKRYIVITGLNVDTPFDNKSPKTKFATDWMYTNYPLTTQDKQLEYSILTKSTIDWTLIRLPMIEQTDAECEIQVNMEDCPGDIISSTALALFLINQLSDNHYIQKSPFIANA